MALLKELQAAAMLGKKTAAEILRTSKPNAKEAVMLKRKPLRFERVRIAVEQMKKECTAPLRTIVAGNKRAADRHEFGSGPRHVNVKQARRGARAIVRKRITVNSIHQHVLDGLKYAGYKRAKKKIDLKKGNVITIEPGIYYRGIDEGRIEDVVVVTVKGFEFLAPGNLGWGL
jgi:hypothetical protein